MTTDSILRHILIRTGGVLIAMTALGDASRAASTQTTLTASLKVVSSCQITKTAPLTFPSVTNVGTAQDARADGTVTYACAGVSPKLSVNDHGSTNETFYLRRSNGNVPFTLCVVVPGGTCESLKNGDRTQIAVPDSGTQSLQGELKREAGGTFKVGDYLDDITVTLSF